MSIRLATFGRYVVRLLYGVGGYDNSSFLSDARSRPPAKVFEHPCLFFYQPAINLICQDSGQMNMNESRNAEALTNICPTPGSEN